MIVQGCLNGARPPSYHPRLPVTPGAIVADAVAAVSAGAHELHIHIRDDEGRETLAPAFLDRTLAEPRGFLPGTFIGISTGAWIEANDERRLAYVDAWNELPDYASVNLGEADALNVIEALVQRGVGIEAGIATVGDVERFLALELAPLSLRVLIEIGEQDAAEAHAVADAILARLAVAGVRKPILLHGADLMVWSFVERSARALFSTRVGLEDGKTLPDGSAAPSNAAIIAAAVEIMASRKGA